MNKTGLASSRIIVGIVIVVVIIVGLFFWANRTVGPSEAVAAYLRFNEELATAEDFSGVIEVVRAHSSKDSLDALDRDVKSLTDEQKLFVFNVLKNSAPLTLTAEIKEDVTDAGSILTTSFPDGGVSIVRMVQEDGSWKIAEEKKSLPPEKSVE